MRRSIQVPKFIQGLEAHSFTAARKIRVRYALVQNTFKRWLDGGRNGMLKKTGKQKILIGGRRKGRVRELGANVVKMRERRLEVSGGTYYHRQSLEADFERN